MIKLAIMDNRQIAVSMVYAVTANNQVTMFQDGYHPRSSNFEFAYSRDVVDAMARGGVRHFVGEYLQNPHQKYIDDLVSGKMSEKDFKAEMMNYWGQQPEDVRTKTVDKFTDFVKYAHDKGIKVHALDKHLPAANTMGLVASIGSSDGVTVGDMLDGIQKLKKMPEFSSDKEKLEMSEKYLKGFDRGVSINSSEFQDKFGADALNEKIGADKDLAKRIKHTCGNEKTVVMFGEGHGSLKDGSKGRDLDEHLRAGGKILLTPSEYTYQQTKDMLGSMAKETPTTVIFTDYSNRPGNQVGGRITKEDPKMGAEHQGREDIKSYRPAYESDLKPENVGHLKPPHQSILEKIGGIFR